MDGSGGPFDVGEPHPETSIITLDLAPTFPEGLLYYTDTVYRAVFFNWAGSLSFRWADTNGLRSLPRDSVEGIAAPRIVAFGHASSFAEFGREGERETPTFYAHIPPGPDGEPGRFVATWYRATNNEDFPPLLPAEYNTWQVVLTGPDPADYTLELRYHQCQWTYPLNQTDFKATMGLDGGQGIDGPGWEWSGARSDDMLDLCRLSNVREPGVFRYRVIDGVPTGCGPDPDPPPGEGRCADGNHLPGDGCSPACYVEPDADGDGQTEAPHPDSVDPFGVYDRCADPEDEACDDDTDGDGIPPHLDNCDDDDNPEQYDYDGDGAGDECDADDDFDELPDVADRIDPTDICPLLYSASTRRPDPNRPSRERQPDIDRDGVGDACDPDDDGDGVLDCGGDGLCNPDDDGYNNNFDRETDESGECAPGTDCHFGDRDLFDNDGDGFVDESSEAEYPFARWPGPDMPPSLPEDNCRRIPNPDQLDLDGDGVGDACDPDLDGDGIPNCEGNGICGPALDGRDNDEDGAIDEDGECAGDGECADPAADRIDQDLDGWIDEDYEVEQAALDGAVLPARLDNCPLLASQNLDDWDGDGLGDPCDNSDDDALLDDVDNCPGAANPDQRDIDGDGLGDLCDPDRDGDGIPDERDRCPAAADSGIDTDGDGLDDACDPDDDADGVNDRFDGCRVDYDPDQADLDGDGRGDVCDDDDDGDGVADGADVCPRVADHQVDLDRDGLGDACDPDADGDGVDDRVDLCPQTADPEQRDRRRLLDDACDPQDDRPFEARSPEEKCAILIADHAPTAERLRHCPPPTDDGCSTTPGAPTPTVWWWLTLVGIARIGRKKDRPA